MAVNGDVEVCWKYDIVKAVTLKLLRISKNSPLFRFFESKNYYIIEEKVFKKSVRITEKCINSN